MQFVRTYERMSIISIAEDIEKTMEEKHAKVVSTAFSSPAPNRHLAIVVFEKLVPWGFAETP